MTGSSAHTVTAKDIDALVSGATPQFSQQIMTRVWALISALPEGNEVRAYGERQIQILDALSFGTTRGESAPGRPAADAEGWDAIPSHP